MAYPATDQTGHYPSRAERILITKSPAKRGNLTSGPGAARTYGTYWTRITEAFGERHLDEVTTSEIEALKRQLVANRQIRRNDRGGQSVAEHLVSAMRAVYTQAINDNLLPPHHNPALKVTKPRPRPVTRYALAPNEVAALADVVAASGRDAVLDTLLFRLHLESACRRGGALALREEDIEPTSCLIRLREKNNTVRMQPVSPTLIAALLAHRQHRGNGRSTTEPLLRHHNGNPINRRRYDRMWQRLADRVPWVAARNISTHWLRHTTLTWVDRHYGPSITRGYAGHTDPRGDNVTGTYTKATLPEIATALAAYTREPHPRPSPRHRMADNPCSPPSHRCTHDRTPDTPVRPTRQALAHTAAHHRPATGLGSGHRTPARHRDDRSLRPHPRPQAAAHPDLESR